MQVCVTPFAGSFDAYPRSGQRNSLSAVDSKPTHIEIVGREGAADDTFF
jgi:hypothetical protein